MGFIEIFVNTRKYDSRSGYLKGRKEAMMKRVEKICMEGGFKLKKSLSPPVKRANLIVDKRLYSGLKGKIQYLLFVIILVFLLYLLNYL